MKKNIPSDLHFTELKNAPPTSEIATFITKNDMANSNNKQSWSDENISQIVEFY